MPNRRLLTRSLVAAAGLCSPFVLPDAARADGDTKSTAESLPIRRITLYRSGVGSFDRRGMVDGNATIQMRFKTDQINDILKSMVVLDLSKGQGTIDGISYSSKEPLARRLASFGIDISDNPATGEILQRLRGTAIKLTTPEGVVSGTIMNVETRPTVYSGGGEKGTVVHSLPWINVIQSGGGVRAVNLTTVSGFEILDAKLSEELNKALAALADYRADRTKTVDIKLSGSGAREVAVAYVQEMPIWKTSYRLVLPDPKPNETKSSKTPDALTIQGWAIVENTTDEDWNNVALSLVSGRPVSFVMDLYEPLYLSRPTVPVPTIPGVAPKTYAGGQVRDEERVAERRALGSGGVAAKTGRNVPAAPAAAARAPMEAGDALAATISSEDLAGYGARAQAQGAEVGEVFQFQLDHPVTVERQRSAMLPIIATNVEGRRVSIYTASESPEHPMRGVELTNSTGLQLMPGPISVFDAGAYAGDAQIGHVPAGDKRLLAYSVDLDVDSTFEPASTDTIHRVRFVKGMLETTTKQEYRSKYTFTNKDQKRARTIIVEQPRSYGWDLVEPSKPKEENQGLYRFEVSADAGKQASLTVVQARTTSQMVAFNGIRFEDMVAYQRSGKVSSAVLDAFKEAARRQGQIDDTQRRIAEIEAERNQITQDQARVRQNMERLDRTTELYQRYVKNLTDQETRMDASGARLNELRTQLTRQQADLQEYLSSLSVD